MGYFLGCFRAKDRHRDRPSPEFASLAVDRAPSRKARVSQNQLSDLFVSQEMAELSCTTDNGIQPEIVDKEVNDEVHFPKASRKILSDALDPETLNSNTSFQNIYNVADLNKQQVQPLTPYQLHELKKGLDSVEESPASCITDVPNVGRTSISRSQETTCNEVESNISSAVVSSIQLEEQDSQKWIGSHIPGNQSSSDQKHGVKATSEQEGLSSWLKPAQHHRGNKVNYDRPRRTIGDRPILGTVASHCNEEVDPPPVSMKWWDGNGIPNSTNKYREDQKVSWHVTPFEERLEKALSEENSIKKRSHISGTRNVFEESAIDSVPSLPQPKSVVSF